MQTLPHRILPISINMSLKVGDRVEHKESCGSLRYIGTLPGRQGTWLGVDWDDKTRGRHDGSYEGIHYFETRHPTSGSFIKAEKMKQGGRRSFLDAVNERFAISGSIKSMHSIDVSGMGVCDSFAENLPVSVSDARVLRVSDSLLNDFGDVYSLLATFHNLEQFDVARNCFHVFPQKPMLEPRPKLLRLDLNGTHISQEILRDFVSRLPNLQELRLYDTGLNSLHPEISKLLGNVRLIDLGGNPIPFDEICSVIGALPLLRELYLVGCAIDGTESFPTHAFPALWRLSLSENPLRAWTIFSTMVTLPSLRLLQATDTPLTADLGMEPQDDTLRSRDAIIARLPMLERLHGTDITEDERMYAEKRYVTCCGSIWAQGGKVRQDYPRIQELANKYGIEVGGVKKRADGVAETLQADLIPVEMRCQDTVITKDLPRSISTGKLRVLTLSLLRIPRDAQVKVTFQHGTTIANLVDSNQRLSDMYVRLGDKVIVNVLRT